MTRRVILAFPLNHRRKLIAAIARQMLARSPVEAEKHLQLQLRHQAAALRRRQLPEKTIRAQTLALDRAVRAELWRVVVALPPNGRNAKK
jgi:hypothetical protein